MNKADIRHAVSLFHVFSLLVVLFVGGLNLAFAQQTAADSPAVASETSGITVGTRLLSELWFKKMLRASAEAMSLNHPQISAQATGEVLGIEVEVGDLVAKDAVLVRLDCRQSEFDQAVLNDAHALALKEFRRAQSLQRKNAIAEQQLTQATSTLEQARIRKNQAALSVEHCLVSAPFAGVVTRRQVQLGAVAVPGSPILTLLQTDAVEVQVSLTREDLSSIGAAEKIHFISEGYRYPLTFRSALPVVDRVSSKRAVRLSIIGEAPFPGAPGDVVWQSAGHFLPVELIVSRKGSLGYFIEQEGIAHFIALKHAKLGHPARIDTPGLDAENIQVIVGGRFRLEHGSKIRTQRMVDRQQ